MNNFKISHGEIVLIGKKCDDWNELIEKIFAGKSLALIKKIEIPEADIFQFEFDGKTWNLKLDFDYGASIESVATDFDESCAKKLVEKLNSLLLKE